MPGPVLVAFWGLETDFGAFMGKMESIRSLATLSYDCRRPEEFKVQLMDALRVIDRGDLTPRQMRGPAHGEVGQFQFQPSTYYNYAVDYDGDGRRDLVNSAPDSLASAANYLKAKGWQAGQPWLEEVRVPANLPWEQADVTIQQPRAFWAKNGVTYRNGKKLRADNTPTSLLRQPGGVPCDDGISRSCIRRPRPITPRGSLGRRRSTRAMRNPSVQRRPKNFSGFWPSEASTWVRSMA